MSRRLTIPSLILPYLVSIIPSLIISLLLIEIAASFNVEVGVAGQLSTAASMVSGVMALLMGVLSVKYRHKSLLLAGVVVLCVASLGCYVAPSFGLLLAVFSFTGISMAMVLPMSQALIGALFTVEDRPQVLGYLMGGMAISYVLGPPIISYLGDWRLSFVVFALPLTLFSLFLAIKGVPSTATSTPSNPRPLQGFHEVLRNRSAVACVVANILSIMAIRVISFYGIPFYRQHFVVDTTVMAVIVSGVSLMYIPGSVIGGRVVNRVGRKRLTVASSLLLGVATLAFPNIPDPWITLMVWVISAFFMGSRNTAYNSLTLEQVPGYRGTMMSLSQLSTDIAGVLGGGIGGLILVAFDYGHMGALGIAALIAALLFHVFAIDPTQQAKH